MLQAVRVEIIIIILIIIRMMFMELSLWLRAVAKVHPVHAMNLEQHTSGC